MLRGKHNETRVEKEVDWLSTEGPTSDHKMVVPHREWKLCRIPRQEGDMGGSSRWVSSGREDDTPAGAVDRREKLLEYIGSNDWSQPLPENFGHGLRLSFKMIHHVDRYVPQDEGSEFKVDEASVANVNLLERGKALLPDR